jgi:seryl-tRNA synthetase
VIDPQTLRDHPDLVIASQELRGASVEVVDQAVAADSERRRAVTEFEGLRAEQNAHGKLVAKADKADKPRLIAEVQELKARVTAAQERAQEAEAALDEAMRRIPNIVLDMGRGAKVSGARFHFLKGIGARLEIALMNFGLARALEAGLVPLITPTLVKPEIMAGTGFLGAHADEVYHLDDDDLYLTGTSEVALAGYHADEILDLAAGPVRYAGWSTCYRKEAGSYGKDTRGIIRVHQFQKLEMFSYVDPADAEAEHERLLAMQERMMQDLGLSYRVIDTAAGDLGSSAARKYDVEAWIPTQGAYRELTSTSNCTTFQARRLGTRFRGEDGRTSPVATLNGTLATTRWIVAILETHQQADGSVRVPEALRPYLGGLATLAPAPARAAR